MKKKILLNEIYLSVEEIEKFKEELSRNPDNQIMKLMATRAVEREIEIISKNWTLLKSTYPYIFLKNITYFLNMDRILRKRYAGQSNEKLLWSVIEQELAALKDEIAIKLADLTPKPISKFLNAGINYKKPQLLYASVHESGKPNKVKIFVSEAYIPIFPLMNYRNPIKEKENIVVEPSFSKDKILIQVSFRDFFKGVFLEDIND